MVKVASVDERTAAKLYAELNPELEKISSDLDSKYERIKSKSRPTSSTPPSSPETTIHPLDAKLKNWINLKDGQPAKHFNEILAANRAFRNPSILSSLIKVYDIDEFASAVRPNDPGVIDGSRDNEKNIIQQCVATLDGVAVPSNQAK